MIFTTEKNENHCEQLKLSSFCVLLFSAHCTPGIYPHVHSPHILYKITLCTLSTQCVHTRIVWECAAHLWANSYSDSSIIWSYFEQFEENRRWPWSWRIRNFSGGSVFLQFRHFQSSFPRLLRSVLNLYFQECKFYLRKMVQDLG